MKFANKYLVSGFLIGALVVLGGLAVHAHEKHPSGDGMQGGNGISMTGSPEALSQRARQLGEHICANIDAKTNCPITPISNTAANELSEMQTAFAQGQVRLHETLTAANLDRAEFERIKIEQTNGVQASSLRYMQFLGDASAALTPDQRQMFSPQTHAGH